MKEREKIEGGERENIEVDGGVREKEIEREAEDRWRREKVIEREREDTGRRERKNEIETEREEIE